VCFIGEFQGLRRLINPPAGMGMCVMQIAQRQKLYGGEIQHQLENNDQTVSNSNKL
jgi:hypothetical protein